MVLFMLKNTFSLNKSQIIAIFGILICGLMMSAAIPRLISALYMFYPAQVNTQFKKDSTLVGLKHHIKAEDYAINALKWFESSEIWQTLTVGKARQLVFIKAEFQSQKIKEMYETNIQGLALSPIDPYSWYRLAIIQKKLHAPTHKILNNLRLSCYSGRIEPSLLIKRVSLFNHYMPSLNTEMLEIMYDQIQLSSMLKMHDLVKLVQQQPILMTSVKKALQYDLDHWTNFIQLFEKTTHKN